MSRNYIIKYKVRDGFFTYYKIDSITVEQIIKGDVFTFLDLNTKALELESGVAVNEPVTYAIRTAIEYAILDLIKTGKDKGYWKYKEEKVKGIHEK